MALEKKSDYGKTQASFILSSRLNVSYGATAFLVISRFKSPGKFQPVYKSEAKGALNGKVTWS